MESNLALTKSQFLESVQLAESRMILATEKSKLLEETQQKVHQLTLQYNEKQKTINVSIF